MVTNACSQASISETGASSVLGVFVASTPCSKGTRPLPGISAEADCEFIKWNLTFYQDPDTHAPTTYKLRCVYGLPKQGTNGFIGGGTNLELEGRWAIVRGTKADPNAIVYQLDPDKPQSTVCFLRLDDHLLHLLDSEGELMIGSPSWSYTLNRADN
jgi:hypothetical protein